MSFTPSPPTLLAISFGSVFRSGILLNPHSQWPLAISTWVSHRLLYPKYGQIRTTHKTVSPPMGVRSPTQLSKAAICQSSIPFQSMPFLPLEPVSSKLSLTLQIPM